MTEQRKTALVTGASSGIGRATAIAFARAGYDVAVAATRMAAVEETCAEIRAEGVDALALRVDVADAGSCEEMVAQIADRFGRLDAAFNNAGINEMSLIKDGGPPPTHELPLDIWRRVLAVDLDGIFHSVRAELPLMLQGGGAIVNTGSMQSHVAIPRNAAYTAAKHGVMGFTKVVAKEYGGQGIRCNMVSPGVVDTPMTTEVINSAEYKQPLLSAIPLGRFAEREEISNAILWLCSDAATYVNGATLIVDGGYLA